MKHMIITLITSLTLISNYKNIILYFNKINALCITVYAIIFAYSYFRGFGQVR